MERGITNYFFVKTFQSISEGDFFVSFDYFASTLQAFKKKHPRQRFFYCLVNLIIYPSNQADCFIFILSVPTNSIFVKWEFLELSYQGTVNAHKVKLPTLRE